MSPRYPYVKRRFEDSRAPRWLGFGFAAAYLIVIAIIGISIVARLV